MTMSLVLYGVPLSPFVRKAEVVLREKGLEFDLEPVNIMPMPDWFKAISPARRIPVLRDRSVSEEGPAGTIADSSAICAFAERRAPDPALYPKDPFDCGRAIWFEEWADTELAGEVGMGVFRPVMFPRFQGKPSDIATASISWRERLPRLFDYVETELQDNEFLVGGALSIADISVTSQMTNLQLVAGLPDPARWPRLVSHTERISGRESFDSNLSICRKIIKEPIDLDG
jgi:glutathione S-transferase